jgi:hypothetical protein
MSPAAVFKDWLAVKPAAGRALAVLYEAAGELVPIEDMLRSTGQTRNGLYLSTRDLRQTMDRGAIKNEHGVGYRLTEVGMAECRRALADASQTQVAA